MTILGCPEAREEYLSMRYVSPPDKRKDLVAKPSAPDEKTSSAAASLSIGKDPDPETSHDFTKDFSGMAKRLQLLESRGRRQPVPPPASSLSTGKVVTQPADNRSDTSLSSEVS